MNITKARKLVRICYEIILDRTPSSSEIEWWAKAVVNNKSDETDLIYSFISSKEFSEKNRKK